LPHAGGELTWRACHKNAAGAIFGFLENVDAAGIWMDAARDYEGTILEFNFAAQTQARALDAWAVAVRRLRDLLRFPASNRGEQLSRFSRRPDGKHSKPAGIAWS
jgi:hypothetical protein